MRTLVALLAGLALTASAQSQQSPDIFDVVDEPPQIVGGMEALVAAVVYPEAAAAAGTEGRVIVQFVVDETGAVSDPVAVVSPDSALSAAAVRAVESVAFTPGRQGGEAVRVRFAVPVTFRLAEPPCDAEDPVLIGGFEGLAERLRYPDAAFEQGVGGTVRVQFEVGRDGRPRDAAALAGDPLLHLAALDAVRASAFEPATECGEPVPVRVELPITFEAPPEVHGLAEEPPVLIGGLVGLQARVVYPDEARRKGIQGRVIVQFVVDEEGRVVDETVVASPHPLLARAALDAVRGSAFEPARIDGRPVRVQFSVPVTFALR